MRDKNSFFLVAIILIALGYSIIHASLRYGASLTLGSEDSLASVYAQQWAWGYTSDKPPLYVWMIAFFQRVVGSEILAVLVVKYTLLIATTVCTYLAGYVLFRDRLWAFVGALSLSLCFEIGWSMHESVTYAAPLSTMVMATLWTVFRLGERPNWSGYFLLGYFAAFGLLSNYNFLFFLLTLLPSAFSLTTFRRSLQTRQALLSVTTTLIVIAPFLFWLITQNPTDRPHASPPSSPEASASASAAATTSAPSVAAMHSPVEQFGGRLNQLMKQSYLRRFFVALVNMIQGPFLFLFPLIVVLPAVFRGMWSRLFRATVTFGKEGLETDKERLLLRMTMLSFALLAGAVLIGFDRGGSQYMHPFFLPAVLLLTALAKHQTRRQLQFHAYLAILFSIAVVAVAVRAAGLFIGPPMCGPCEMWEAFEPLTQALHGLGCEGGTLLVTDRVTAGNVRAACPSAHVFIVEPRRLMPRGAKIESDNPIAVITRAEHEEQHAIQVFHDDYCGVGPTPEALHSFRVSAVWQASKWQPTWHPTSAWFVSIYSPAGFCHLLPSEDKTVRHVQPSSW